MKAYKPWEESHLFSCEISRRMPSESCLGTPWGPSYEQIFVKAYILPRDALDETHGSKRAALFVVNVMRIFL